MKPGTQIAYIPHHAKSVGLAHPDVEYGFVMSERGDSHFCRYWCKGHLRDLRTIANSELTPNDCLVEMNSVPQELVDALVEDFARQASERRRGPCCEADPTTTKDTYTFGITWFASNLRHLIVLKADQTLHNLHQAICEEFKLADETHMYRFFVPSIRLSPSKASRGGWHLGKISKLSKEYFDPREYGSSPVNFLFPPVDADNALKTTIGSLNLKSGQYFYYLFDFGDEQWFTISVQRITPREGKF